MDRSKKFRNNVATLADKCANAMSIEVEDAYVDEIIALCEKQFVERACALTDEKLSELIGAQSDVADIHAILVAGDVIKQALRDEFK